MPTCSKTQLLEKIIDPHEPFSLFFCVREIARKKFAIGHDNPDPWHLLYLPEVGDLHLQIGDHERVIEVGEILWIQPQVRFQLRGLGKPGKINISVCRFDLDRSNPYRTEEDYLVGSVKPRELLLNDLLAGKRIEGAAEQLRARAVLGHIIGNAFFDSEEQQNSDSSDGLSPIVRKQCIDYIQSHIHQRIVIAEIANHVRLNADYFARQFKKSFGISPQGWVKNIRIQEAADHLLSGSSSITEIADQYGFSNVYFFSRQFKEVMGVSPKKWLKDQVPD